MVLEPSANNGFYVNLDQGAILLVYHAPSPVPRS